MGAVGVIARRWSAVGSRASAASAASAALLLGALLAACAGGDDADQGDGGDGSDGVEVRCPLVRGCPDWLEAYEREVIGTLSGERPIDGDVSLSERFSEDERAMTRAYISDQLAGFGLEPRLDEYPGGANVIAELAGTGEDDALVVVGAHLDTVRVAPGAADDGTGVALVLAAARYLSELERRDHTVVFALFDGEEVGFKGSSAFANELRLDGASVLAMHQFDMLSWDLDGDRGVELWAPAPALEALYRDAADEVGVPVASFEFYSSDHSSFIGAGFAAIGVGEQYVEGDSTPFYHQPSDTYDKIDFDYVTSTTVLGLRALERQLGASGSAP
ncbi:MAG TPA: M28 family metallopeptidase [Kofleriaceae bacterium]|nr:M28 family metallopeptidase [Kofleriaceae bacterium]